MSKDEAGRQGVSKGSGSENVEDRRRSGPGSGPGREMPGRRAGVVGVFLRILKQLYVADWQ